MSIRYCSRLQVWNYSHFKTENSNIICEIVGSNKLENYLIWYTKLSLQGESIGGNWKRPSFKEVKVYSEL